MKTILYIDSSEIYRLLIEEELSQEGFQVVTASSIEEALSKWREIDPGLVILELRQNRLSDEVFEKLKKKYPGVLWIGYSTYYQCPEEFKKWINFYLPKSSRIEEIKTFIQGLQITG
jgi:DNA-binding NtrC family response regulator